MALSHVDVGLKILAKIKIYLLTRAELFCSFCNEIPCMKMDYTFHGALSLSSE